MSAGSPYIIRVSQSICGLSYQSIATCGIQPSKIPHKAGRIINSIIYQFMCTELALKIDLQSMPSSDFHIRTTTALCSSLIS